ncbi:MAG: hypothetical protein KME50_27640, partial [Nostoc desertorum CM1-VF14]|nr:hypothetical protein [Nostoc desertorum CM1-VF14]
GLTTVMQGFWAILPSFLAPEYTSRVFLSTDCHLFFLFQQALNRPCCAPTKDMVFSLVPFWYLLSMRKS